MGCHLEKGLYPMMAIRVVASTLAAVGGMFLLFSAVATAKATPRVDERMINLDNARVSVVCDQVTGNLIYVMRSGYGGGVAVVEKGCVAK